MPNTTKIRWRNTTGKQLGARRTYTARDGQLQFEILQHLPPGMPEFWACSVSDDHSMGGGGYTFCRHTLAEAKACTSKLAAKAIEERERIIARYPDGKRPTAQEHMAAFAAIMAGAK